MDRWKRADEICNLAGSIRPDFFQKIRNWIFTTTTTSNCIFAVTVVFTNNNFFFTNSNLFEGGGGDPPGRYFTGWGVGSKCRIGVRRMAARFGALAREWLQFRVAACVLSRLLASGAPPLPKNSSARAAHGEAGGRDKGGVRRAAPPAT